MLFLSGQHLCDSGHCSRDSHTNVMEGAAGSSGIMKVDLGEVARSGRVGPDDLSVAISSPPPPALPFPLGLRALFQTSCLWQWVGEMPLQGLKPTQGHV